MLASEAVRAACASSGLCGSVRIAAGFGLSPDHREAAMGHALVTCPRLLPHLPRACGTDTDSRILLAGRLSVSSGPVYAPAPAMSVASLRPVTPALICCSLPDDLGEVFWGKSQTSIPISITMLRPPPRASGPPGGRPACRTLSQRPRASWQWSFFPLRLPHDN